MLPPHPSPEQVVNARTAILSLSRQPQWIRVDWFDRIVTGLLLMLGTADSPPSEDDVMEALRNPAYHQPVIEILNESRTAEQARLN